MRGRPLARKPSLPHDGAARAGGRTTIPVAMPLSRLRPLAAGAACLLACTLVPAAPPPSLSQPLPPKPLLAQVQRLAELLRDARAVYYPEATLVQRLRL